jgi:hypothetical protein
MARRAKRDKPTNILALVRRCVESPAYLTEIGSSGIAGGTLRLQVLTAYAAVALGIAFATAALTGDFNDVGAEVLGNVISLAATTVGLFVVAPSRRQGGGLVNILLGLAFIRSMTSALVLVLLGVIGAPLFFISPALGLVIAGIAVLIALIATLVWQMAFIMGLLDTGCGGAILWGIVAGFVAMVVERAFLVYVMGVNP